MTRKLEASAVLAEDQSLARRTHIKCLKTTWDSSSWYPMHSYDFSKYLH